MKKPGRTLSDSAVMMQYRQHVESLKSAICMKETILQHCRIWDIPGIKSCQLCEFVTESQSPNSLISHLYDRHRIKRYDGGLLGYLKKYFKKHIPTCACGCKRLVDLRYRGAAFAEFATGCPALNHCRNPSRPEFYIYRGYSVDDTIAAIRKRASTIAAANNTPEFIEKLKAINSGQSNPSSLQSIMVRHVADAPTARKLLKKQRQRGTGFLGKKHTPETKQHSAAIRSLQAKIVTKPELVIWGMLHALGVDFEFQYPIAGYVVDFYIPALNVALDVFGNYWHRRAMKSVMTADDEYAEQRRTSDAVRDKAITSAGFTTVVFWESDIMLDPQATVARLKDLCTSTT